MDKDVANQSPRTFSVNDEANLFLADEDEAFNSDPMLRQETIELVRAYYKIPNRRRQATDCPNCVTYCQKPPYTFAQSPQNPRLGKGGDS